MVQSYILSLLFGPDGMRQGVVTDLQFPEEKCSVQLREYFYQSSDSLHNGLGEIIKRLFFLVLLFVGFHTAARRIS